MERGAEVDGVGGQGRRDGRSQGQAEERQGAPSAPDQEKGAQGRGQEGEGRLDHYAEPQRDPREERTGDLAAPRGEDGLVGEYPEEQEVRLAEQRPAVVPHGGGQEGEHGAGVCPARRGAQVEKQPPETPGRGAGDQPADYEREALEALRLADGPQEGGE